MLTNFVINLGRETKWSVMELGRSPKHMDYLRSDVLGIYILKIQLRNTECKSTEKITKFKNFTK